MCDLKLRKYLIVIPCLVPLQKVNKEKDVARE